MPEGHRLQRSTCHLRQQPSCDTYLCHIKATRQLQMRSDLDHASHTDANRSIPEKKSAAKISQQASCMLHSAVRTFVHLSAAAICGTWGWRYPRSASKAEIGQAVFGKSALPVVFPSFQVRSTQPSTHMCIEVLQPSSTSPATAALVRHAASSGYKSAARFLGKKLAVWILSHTATQVCLQHSPTHELRHRRHGFLSHASRSACETCGRVQAAVLRLQLPGAGQPSGLPAKVSAICSDAGGAWHGEASITETGASQHVLQNRSIRSSCQGTVNHQAS